RADKRGVGARALLYCLESMTRWHMLERDAQTDPLNLLFGIEQLFSNFLAQVLGSLEFENSDHFSVSLEKLLSNVGTLTVLRLNDRDDAKTAASVKVRE